VKYVEIDLGPEETDPNAEMMKTFARMPAFLIKILFRMNLKKIRSGMGGESRDITRRTVRWEDRTIGGYADDLRIRVYTPDGDATRPLMMFHHGGGWFGGSIDAVEDFCKGVADQADCVVISVDYHLAPEHKFPTGIEDSYKALQWAIGHADELRIDPGRVTVGGDSAGGNIAAVLTAMANDRRDVSIGRQVLIYPAIDNTFGGIRKSFPGAASPFEAVMKLYLGDKRLSDHPYVSPNMYADLPSLPEALIAVGELDGLRVTSLAYAEALDDSGVGVEFIVYKNANHAFIDDTGNNDNADHLATEIARFVNQRPTRTEQ